MRRPVEILLAVLGAVLIYTLLGRISPALILVINAFSLVVVYLSISRGEVFGAFIGTVCGLVQDSFSAGVFGLAGLTKTLLGYGTGFVSRRIDVASFWRRSAFVLVMTFLELGAWVGLKSLIFSERVYLGRGLLLLQPPATALAIGLFFAVLRRFEKRSP